MMPSTSSPRTGRPAVLLALSLAACSPEKVGSDSETSTGAATSTDATTDEPVTSTSSTTGVTTTAVTGTGDATGTTGPVSCAEPPPQCSECAPGCAVARCVDELWECGCEACGSTDTDTDTDTTSTGTTGDTTGGGIVCTGDDPQFPEFDETCAVDEDCAIVFHQLDCCGSLAAWGINADAAKPFAEAEELCEAQIPGCDCAPKPTVTDDGASVDDNAKVEVHCKRGLCESFAP